MNIFTAIYRRFVPAPTVGSIMASFEKQQRALEAVTEKANAETQALTQNITDLRAQRVRAVNESAKAERIARNLKQFTA